jgi:hypothetical protein
MASDSIWGPKSIPASADLRAYQFRFMRLDSNGQLALPHLGSFAITVLQDKPTAQGQPGQCCRPGDITKVYVATSLSQGDYVATDATGQAITCVTGDVILGQSLDTVTVNGIARIVFQPMGKI